ncbi:hypothetical protein [Bradyrhizobium sp. USDA 4473]
MPRHAPLSPLRSGPFQRLLTDEQPKPDLVAIKAETRENVDDMTDCLLKAANAPMLAHGGAMIACLYQLKDYGTNPHVKYIGLAITAFGLGFIVAVLSYIGIGVGRLKLMLAIFNADFKGFMRMPIVPAANLLYLSVGNMLLAVLAIVWRFYCYKGRTSNEGGRLWRISPAKAALRNLRDGLRI